MQKDVLEILVKEVLEEEEGGLPVGGVVAIVIVVLVGLSLLLLIVYYIFCRKHRKVDISRLDHKRDLCNVRVPCK